MSDAELHPRRGHVLLAFLPALTVLLACFVQRPGETDLWWHLRAGEWMVAHGQIPHVDPFSLSRGGEPWTNFEWLYQLAVYGLQCAGGLPLVIFGHAALAAVGFWGALRAAAATTSVSARALAGALAAGTQFIYAFARPQVVTLALTGVYLALLGEQRRVTRGRAALILLLQVVWVNAHGGYAFGLLLLALWAAERRFVTGWTPRASELVGATASAGPGHRVGGRGKALPGVGVRALAATARVANVRSEGRLSR